MYRLLWFQHFHKAAGTTIVQTALANAETLFPRHANGNPRDSNDERIRPWAMGTDELTAFVDQCEGLGVTFVATEWGVPNLQCLARDPRVRLFTCIRDPWTRFLSNFYYDLHSGYTEARTIQEYHCSGGLFTYPHYYCRLLSRMSSADVAVSPALYEEALSAIQLFEYCAVVESRGFLQGLCRFLGWRNYSLQANTSPSRCAAALSHVTHGRLAASLRCLLYKAQTSFDSCARRQFLRDNSWDYMLYHTVATASTSTASPRGELAGTFPQAMDSRAR